jgi:hypothetical protein
MNLGAVRLVQPGTVRQASRRLAQAPAQAKVSVMATIDGAAAPDVDVEVMYADGSFASGKTSSAGLFEAAYAPAQYGPAVVRVIPPAGVQDIGEGSAQPAELAAAGMRLSFAFLSMDVAPTVNAPMVAAVTGLTVLLLGVTS